MQSQTKQNLAILLNVISNNNLDSVKFEKLCYCCQEFNISMERLKGSIDKYQKYKNNKNEVDDDTR